MDSLRLSHHIPRLYHSYVAHSSNKNHIGAPLPMIDDKCKQQFIILRYTGRHKITAVWAICQTLRMDIKDAKGLWDGYSSFAVEADKGFAILGRYCNRRHLQKNWRWTNEPYPITDWEVNTDIQTIENLPPTRWIS